MRMTKLPLIGSLFACIGLISVHADELLTLPGEFNVTNRGSANYRIPLRVSPGRAGLEPELALQYSSNAPDGILGKGWSISGLSSIHIEGLNHFDDSTYSVPQYDLSQDKLSLDGERLVLISGTYGAVNSVYRTKMESFSRITALGISGEVTGFKVEEKGGLVKYYGVVPAGVAGADGNDDAYIQATKADSSQDVPVSWKLKLVVDRNDNYIRYHYNQKQLQRDKIIDGQSVQITEKSTEVFVTSIEYTGGAGARAPFANLEFQYNSSDRFDAIDGWQNKVRTSRTKILDKILVKAKPNQAGAFSLMGEYDLDYFTEPDGQKYTAESKSALLESVEYKAYHSNGTDSITVPKTSFQYQKDLDVISMPDGTTSSQMMKGVYSSIDVAPHYNIKVRYPSMRSYTFTRGIDANGPPREVELKDMGQYFSADFDGDGQQELVCASLQEDVGNGNQYVIIDTFGPDQEFPYDQNTYDSKFPFLELLSIGTNLTNAGGVSFVNASNRSFPQVYIQDFDGDGIDDILHFTAYGSYSYAIQLVGYDSGSDSWEEKAFVTYPITSGKSGDHGFIQPIDIDNNGVPELALFERNSNSDLIIRILKTDREDVITKNYGDFWDSSELLHQSSEKIAQVHLSTFQLIDLTQDGNPELVINEKQSRDDECYKVIEYREGNDVYQSVDGNLYEIFSKSYHNSYYFPGEDIKLRRNYQLKDVNGDGAIDLIEIDEESQRLYSYLNKVHFDSENDLFKRDLSYTYILNGAPFGYGLGLVFDLVDLNGDGNLDVVYAESYYAEEYWGPTLPKDFIFNCKLWPANNHEYTNIGSVDSGGYDSAQLIRWNKESNARPEFNLISADGMQTISAPYQLPDEAQDSEVKRDTLVGITDGVGKEIYVEYERLNAVDHPVYVSDSSRTFPLIPLMSPYRVVSDSKVEIGSREELVEGVLTEVSTFKEMSYRYMDGVIDLESRGFLGFENFSSHNKNTDILTNYVISLEYPAMGVILQEQEFYTWSFANNHWNPGETSDLPVGNLGLLREVTNEVVLSEIHWDPSTGTPDYSPGPSDVPTFFPYIRSSTVKKFTPAQTHDFDSQGIFNGRAPYETLTTTTWYDNMDPEQEPPGQPGDGFLVGAIG